MPPLKDTCQKKVRKMIKPLDELPVYRKFNGQRSILNDTRGVQFANSRPWETDLPDERHSLFNK